MHSYTPNGSTRAASFRRKAGTFFLTPFLFFLLLFFVFSTPEALLVSASSDLSPALEHMHGSAYDCSLDCGAGGTCVPDLFPTFGSLTSYYRSGTVPFRCNCFEQYSGTLCRVHEEGTVADTSQASDSNSDINSDSNSDSNNDGERDDDFFPDSEDWLTSNGCPFECQNGGKCIAIFGGLSFACYCVEPFWGSQCELNGLEEPCELDCSSIVVSISSLKDGDTTTINHDNVSQPKQGAFCVESLENSVSDDQTCVHCEEISKEDEPNCDNLIECKNGGICKIDYQFIGVIGIDSSEENEETSERPLKCSSTYSMPVQGTDGSSKMQTVWMDQPPYTLSCDCSPGFQGKNCEEIDVCGGCEHDGYCISKDTPGDHFASDDFFNFGTDDTNLNDDFSDDDDHDDDDDDFFIYPPVSGDTGDIDCTCYPGHCDQTLCEAGASCIGGICNQDYLISPMCSGGKCSQRHTSNATCIGGDCDQTGAVEATCAGTDCFHDNIEAKTIVPNTGTMSPDFEPFCSCEYGNFGDLCEHTITAICLFDDLGYNQLIHEFCLQLGGLCSLVIGDQFCTNGGICGNYTRDIIIPTEPNVNDVFSCNCPIGFEGVHCEIVNTQAPSLEQTDQQPTTIESVEPVSSSSLSSTLFPQKWYTLLLVLSFEIFCI